ncbi:MAG: hypothetical protein B7X86_05370 [Sphingobacteriales bacterium 17-39-43]|uniref:DUF4175 family protein n=1 Tax=Daejeonella sp. TaxID=2805397 RepID=UPI000BCE2397|nr:DUF4175 family protein [Daejeonella sp.]OYZ32262.1 MAG: hypothetical protein B7Y24_06190 [Sphingobacteriales bacterium 16-39-50]OZA25607.1 MAG: hypothetical protein B7X86_05370 [Sphingobacteriales bacterium 17-39-43]HQT22112.1 hypothetical protein [Daejeonella sp.]HQT57419.1 hypothetical protein [Daejeonella sp.]
MNKPGDNYVYLINKIDGFIRKYYLNKVVKGSILLASSFLAAYLIFTFAEYWGHFDPTVRSILFYTFIAGNTFVLAAYIILPLLAYFRLGNTISHEQASAIIGRHFTPVKDKLLNTLQLKKLSELNPEQRNLIDASINQKVAELRPVPFTSAIHINENRKYLKYLLAPLAIIIIVFFAAPSILSESTERLINHNKRFVKKAPFSFEIINEQLSVVQGSDFTLLVKLTGNEIPDEIYLEDGLNTFKLEKDNIIRFKYTFRNLQKNKKIILKAGEFRSEDYVLEVKARPTLLDFDVFIEYPSYINKSNETLENTGDLSVPEGSRISWKFRAQNSDQIDMVMDKKSFLLKESGENLFNFSYKALKNLSYSIRPLNSEVPESDGVSYELRVVPDLLPIIDVNERTDSVNSKLLYFVGQASDDYGFSKLNFNYRVLSEKTERDEKSEIRSVKLDKNALQSNFFYVWDINEVTAKPGEQIEYYFELFDNDGVNGPKSVKSSIKTLKLPSEAELEKKLEANSEQIKKKMEQAIKKSAQLEKDTKRLNQELLNKKSLSFEERKQIENLLQKQKEIDELVKEIQKENKQNLAEQQEENEQILEKQKQIEELFNNVLDEKTREILKNIEKLLEKNNKNLTQEELSKMQMDNKSLQKELDRILELYKQLEFDQKLTKAIEKLSELADNQEELSEKSKDKKAELEELKDEQKQLQEDFKELKEELSELEQKNEELEQKNDFENQEKAKQEIDSEQQKSSENLEKKDQKKASESQKKAAAEIKKLTKDLQSMQQESEEKESEVNVKSLREILDNLITSSFDQEKTMQTVRQTNTSDPNYIIESQKQKDIQINLKMIEDSLYSLSKKVPQIQSVVNKEIQTINFNVGKAIESLGERRTAEANRNQQFAMTSINNLALMLNEALEQLQQAQQNGKPGGKGKQKQNLSQLSKMQEQLNKNMQKAREDMQKQGQQKSGQQGKSSREMSEQLAKMAREQQMIRQAMQEINKMENKDGKGALGNLDKLMKEMEQTETDLVNKRIQQETLSRQQEILSKLLDAEKADREREQDQKRESKEGITPAPANSIILQEFQKIKQKEIDLLKTVTPSLNSFYKIKVGDYFKYLNSGDK